MELESLRQELSRMKNINRRCLHKIKILRKQLSQKKIDHEVLHNYNNDLKREIKILKKRKYSEINSEKTKSISVVAKATATSMLQKTKELTDELLAFNDFLVQNSGNTSIISSSPGYWINQIPKPSTSQNSNWNFMENGSSFTSIENNGINEEHIEKQPEEQSVASSSESTSVDESDSDESIFPTLKYPFKKRILVEERLQNSKVEHPQEENQVQLPNIVEENELSGFPAQDTSDDEIDRESPSPPNALKTVSSKDEDSMEEDTSEDFSGFENSELLNTNLRLQILKNFISENHFLSS